MVGTIVSALSPTIVEVGTGFVAVLIEFVVAAGLEVTADSIKLVGVNFTVPAVWVTVAVCVGGVTPGGRGVALGGTGVELGGTAVGSPGRGVFVGGKVFAIVGVAVSGGMVGIVC